MSGGVIESAHNYAIQLRESANDGSDFANGDTDYRVVFLGEDGQLHAKDSAGAVTAIGTGGLTVREVDTSPSVAATVLEFPNGTVTDEGGGVARYTPAAGGGMTLLDYKVISTGGNRTTSSENVLVAVDGTNLSSSVTVPASGNLVVVLQGMIATVTQDHMWGLVNGTGTAIAGPFMVQRYTVSTWQPTVYRIMLTGLTPGATQVIRFAFCADGAGATETILVASTLPASQEIYAV